MYYIISYDISNDKLRLRISKHLLASGCFRLQKSVFIAPNFLAKEIKQLKSEVLRLLNCPEQEDTDSMLCVRITPKQVPALWWHESKPPVSFSLKNSEWF